MATTAPPIPDLSNNGFLDALGNFTGDVPGVTSSLINQNTAQTDRLNGFAIPDLSTAFPGQGLENITGGGIVPSGPASRLVGSPVEGNPNGQIIPLSPNNLNKEAIQADTLGYNLSDADFAKRFPTLVAGRNFNINNATANLAGLRDPFLTKELDQVGLGDINFGTGEFTQARNMGAPILSKENRDRTYFNTLLADNPIRAFGLNASDIEKIALANTGGLNMQALGLAQGRANQAISNVNSTAAQNAALISSFGQLAGAGIKAATTPSSPTLSPGFYNSGYGYQVPQGYTPGLYGDAYSGNFYGPDGSYAGNSFTGNGSFFGG